MTLEMYFYIVGTKMFSRSHPGIGFSECGTQARFRFPVTMVAEHAVQPDEHAERREAVNYVSEQWPRLFLLADVVSQVATPVWVLRWKDGPFFSREVSTDAHMTSPSAAAATASDTIARD